MSGMPHVTIESNPNKTVNSQQDQPERYKTLISASSVSITCYASDPFSEYHLAVLLVGFVLTQDFTADSPKRSSVSMDRSRINKKCTSPNAEDTAQRVTVLGICESHLKEK